MARILVVEDNEQICDFLSRRLRRRGHEVFLAHDGESAIACARSAEPQVVLLDMNLPAMDGWTAARAIKADARTKDLAIVALTADAIHSARERALQAGCDECHSKPLDFRKLIAQVEALAGDAENDEAASARDLERKH